MNQISPRERERLFEFERYLRRLYQDYLNQMVRRPPQTDVTDGSAISPNLQVVIDNHNDELHGRESPPNLAQNIYLDDYYASPRWSSRGRLGPELLPGPAQPVLVSPSWPEMERAEAARKAAEEKAVQAFKQTMQEQKEAEEKAVFEYKKSEAERKAELAAKKEAWEAEQLLKKQKEEEKVRLNLLKAGFSPQQVDAIMDPKLAPRVSPGGEFTGTESKYIMVHKDHICVETLTHYHIPWKYDEVRPAF